MAVLCSHIIMFTIYFNPIAIPSEVLQLYCIGTAEQQYGRMRRYFFVLLLVFRILLLGLMILLVKVDTGVEVLFDLKLPVTVLFILLST
jgi:hypothetical protein